MSGSEDEFSDDDGLDEFEESAEEAKGTKKVNFFFYSFSFLLKYFFFVYSLFVLSFLCLI